MKWLIPALALATSAVHAESVPPMVDEAFAAYAALPAKLVPILSEAKDRETADAAASKLLAALPAVYDARSAMQHIPKLEAPETEIVRKKYEATLRQEWGKLFEQIYRLQKAHCHGSLPFFKQFQTLCLMLEK